MPVISPLLAVILAAVGLLVVAWTWASAKQHMSYQIGRDSLRVRLGKLVLRRIRFDDIDRVSKPHSELRWSQTENWRNTFGDSRRLLVVHRRSGLFRRLVITPKHRYEFRRQLRAAIAAKTGTALASDESDRDEAGD